MAERLREVVAGRERDQELVVVLADDAVLDDDAFEAANPGVVVRRTHMIRHAHQVFVFDRHDLLRNNMADEGPDGLELRRLPGE